MMESPHYVDVDGVSTRYFRAGSGDLTFVLIHGGDFRSYSTSGDWAPIWELLASRFGVVAFDKLGQGLTDLPPSDEGFAMSATVDHTLAFLDAVDINNAVLVGHSRGALPAAVAALQRRKRVLAMIVVDSNTLAPEHPDYPKDFYPSIYAEKPDLPDERYIRLELDRNSFSTDHVSEEILSSRMEAALQTKMEGGIRRMKALYETQFVPDHNQVRQEALDAIAGGALRDLPVSVFWGYDDPSAPLSIGYALLDAIAPHIDWTEFYIINQSGHYPYREHPEAVSSLMLDFAGRASAGKW